MYFFYSIKKTMPHCPASATSSHALGVIGEQCQQESLDGLPLHPPGVKHTNPRMGSGIERIRDLPAGSWTGLTMWGTDFTLS